MNYKMVNAGIKSMGELATRLENGEVFWLGGCQVHFNKEANNPFYMDNGILNWRRFADMSMRKEIPWYENIPAQGVWCWVWDVGEEANKRDPLV